MVGPAANSRGIGLHVLMCARLYRAAYISFLLATIALSARTAVAADVALLTAPQFYSDQAMLDTLTQHVESDGHTVTPIPQLTPGALATLDSVDVFIIPDAFGADVGAGLTLIERELVEGFVAAGGILVTLGDVGSKLFTKVFGLPLQVFCCTTNNGFRQDTATNGTHLACGPDEVYSGYNAYFRGVEDVPQASILYTSTGQHGSLSIPYGSGLILTLGWEYHEPYFHEWSDILSRALATALDLPLIDTDSDLIPDECDNCPAIANTDRADADLDGHGDVCDSCPNDYDPDELDTDLDGTADICDGDADDDSVPNSGDNCPLTQNLAQTDGDNDGVGDVCDNCLGLANPDDSGDADSWAANFAANHAAVSALIPDSHEFVVAAPPSTQVLIDMGSFLTLVGYSLDFPGTDGAVAGGQAYFGGASRYVTSKQPLLFMTAVENPLVDDLNIDFRNTGPSSRRVLPLAVNGSRYTIFVWNAVGNSMPSRINLVIVPGDGTTLMHETFYSDYRVTGLASVDSYFYLLFFQNIDVVLQDADAVAIASAFIAQIATPGQADEDGDGQGNVCDSDDDNDLVDDVSDNCVFDANPGQEDVDFDGIGDACDQDADNDGVRDLDDNCLLVVNPAQTDSDSDGAGNECDICPLDADDDIDGDTLCANVDNCHRDANLDQADTDGNGKGDACDVCSVFESGQTLDIRTKVSVSKIYNDGIVGNDRLSFRGEFVLPAGLTFGDIDPLTTAVRLEVLTDEDTDVIDYAAPTSAYDSNTKVGWQVGGGGTKWSFRDGTADPASGIVKILILDRSSSVPNSVRVIAKAKNAELDALNDTDGGFLNDLTPFAVSVAVGDGLSGYCGEKTFGPYNCRHDSKSTKVSCKD